MEPGSSAIDIQSNISKEATMLSRIIWVAYKTMYEHVSWCRFTWVVNMFMNVLVDVILFIIVVRCWQYITEFMWYIATANVIGV